MYPTRHYSPPNKGKRGRLLTFSGEIVGGDVRVGYSSQTRHYSYRRVDSRGECSRQGIRTEYINRSSLFNFGEKVDGVGRSGCRSRTSPFTSYYSGDHGISSNFYSYGDNRI